MPNIFDKLFSEQPQHRLFPSVSLDGFRFTLIGVEPYRTWIDSGQKKPDGTPRRVQSDELVFDETGERVRCIVSLVLTSPEGLSTSASTPFVDRSHYLDEDTLRALLEMRGLEVSLTHPRIEFREQAEQYDPDKPKRWQRVETKLAFAFDGFDFGNAEGGVRQ